MGKLIVLEGTDGSGKATQTAALYDELNKLGFHPHKIEFPRYQEQSSALIRQYLNGDFGKKPSDVNAYAASTFYAVDRYASYKQDWGNIYENGGLILADRYTTSNAVHQGSKLTGKERADYLRWLFHFEYKLIGLPEPDLVLYLDVPIRVTEKNISDRAALNASSPDIHEQDIAYLNQCRFAATEAADLFGWEKIQCTESGKMRSIEAIHADIMQAVKEIL